jgi:transcriptional regulator GlxA family with amidase domain
MNMHLVAVVAFDGVVNFDLSLPCDVFGRARLPDGSPAYRVKVCGVKRRVDAGMLELGCRHGLAPLRTAHTVIVPGVADLDRAVDPRLLEALRSAFHRGVRMASICTGAFVLARAGLLDGKRATTHWLAAAELARRYPEVRVDPAVLYVDEGRILTSAGAAAGLDLCLYLVRRDHGAAVAADSARLAVMPLERAGGQAQFIVHEPPTSEGASLEPVLCWIRENLRRELSLPAIAKRAGMSSRSLSRRFREQTGTTPSQWVLGARVHRAQQLLEVTGQSVERIAGLVGFGSTATFRMRFGEVVGVSPREYRKGFRARVG